MSFRSLPRPSSSLNAKASTVCPYLLDLRSHLFAHSFVAPRKRRRSRLRLHLPPLSPVRLALHENLLAWGVAFFATPLSSPSVILDVLNPKMFVKTGVFRHSLLSCHFFFCVVFKEHFCFDLFRLASLLLENARPRSELRVPRLSFAAPRHTKNLFAKPVWEVTFFQTIPLRAEVYPQN